MPNGLTPTLTHPLVSRTARVHPDEAVVVARQGWIRPGDVRARGDSGVAHVMRAERVEPGVELEPALVGFGDRELERVPRRLGRPALAAGEELRPWLVR